MALIVSLIDYGSSHKAHVLGSLFALSRGNLVVGFGPSFPKAQIHSLSYTV